MFIASCTRKWFAPLGARCRVCVYCTPTERQFVTWRKAYKHAAPPEQTVEPNLYCPFNGFAECF